MPTHLLRVSSLAVNVKVEGEERNKLEEDMVDEENVSMEEGKD